MGLPQLSYNRVPPSYQNTYIQGTLSYHTYIKGAPQLSQYIHAGYPQLSYLKIQGASSYHDTYIQGTPSYHTYMQGATSYCNIYIQGAPGNHSHYKVPLAIIHTYRVPLAIIHTYRVPLAMTGQRETTNNPSQQFLCKWGSRIWCWSQQRKHFTKDLHVFKENSLSLKISIIWKQVIPLSSQSLT